MANDGTSKRTQGPGDSKGATKKPAPRDGHRKRSGLNLDSEQSARLLLYGAVAAVMAIAVAFLVFGYWYSVVRPRHRTVLAVDSISVSYEAMKRRMAHEFLANTNYQTQSGLQILPEAAYQTLLNELTTTTQAESKLGITLTQEEFDVAFRERIVVSAQADQRTYADGLRKELDKTGLTEAELRRLVRADAMTRKIQDKFKAEAPATTLQAKLEVISTQTEEAAKQAIDLINGGEEFATVAKSVSREADVQTTGGVHEYGPKGSFNATYDDYAFTGEIGKLSAPLSSGNATSPTFYVVRVIDRSDQPTQESEKPAIASQRLADWLKSTQDELQAAGKIKRDWEQQAQGDALLSVVEHAGPKLAAQQRKQQEDQRLADEARQTAIAGLTASAGTPAADATPAPGTTPGAETTPVGEVTPAGSGSTPAAPSQPVAPGDNGQ